MIHVRRQSTLVDPPTFTCATCGLTIPDPSEGSLIADQALSDDLTTIGPRYWRIVHTGVCNPQRGPWYRLGIFTSRNGPMFFRALQRDQAFRLSTAEEISALRLLLLGE